MRITYVLAWAVHKLPDFAAAHPARRSILVLNMGFGEDSPRRANTPMKRNRGARRTQTDSNLHQIRMRSFTAGQDSCCYKRPMLDALSNAYGGIRTASAGFQKAAENVVKSTMPESKEDLPAALVGTKTSATAFKANIAVFKTADKMLGTLLDTIA